MKRKSLSYLGVALAVAMLGTSFTMPVNAKSVDCEVVLVENGVPKDVIEACDTSTKKELLRQIQEDNADFHNAVTSISIPVLDELLEFEKCSDSELKQMGMTEEQIETAETQIESFLELEETQAMKDYHISKAEYKIYKDAMKNGDKYKRKDKNGRVKASGTISASRLSLLLSNSVSTVKKTKNKKTKSYHRNKLSATFCWSKLPVIITTDYLAITWASDVFNVNSTSDAIRYYKIADMDYQNIPYSSQIATGMDREPYGVVYELPFIYWSPKDRSVYMRSGTCVCYLDGAYPLANSNANGEFDAFVKYYHQTVGFSIGISIPAGLTIQATGAYNQSKPVFSSTKLIS